MAIPTIPITLRDVVVTFEDATGTPISATAIYEEGNFSISGMQEGDKAVNVFKDRGDIYSARYGEQEAVDVSITLHATTIYEGTDTIPLDAVNKTGAFSGGISTWGTETVDPWMVKIVAAVEGVDRGDTDKTITIPYFRGTASISDGNPMTIEISGQAYPKGATAAVTRA